MNHVLKQRVQWRVSQMPEPMWRTTSYVVKKLNLEHNHPQGSAEYAMYATTRRPTADTSACGAQSQFYDGNSICSESWETNTSTWCLQHATETSISPLVSNSTTRTLLANTSNGRDANNVGNNFTTNGRDANKILPHPNILTCRDNIIQ